MPKGSQDHQAREERFGTHECGNTRNSKAGFALLEVVIGGAVLATAIMGVAVGVLSSFGLAMKTKQNNLANDMAITVAEECLDAASIDFNSALASFHLKEETHQDMTVKTEIILDETVFKTPIDLNGDGDYSDTDLLPGDCTGAFLRTTVTFSSGQSRAFMTLVSRQTTPLGAVPTVSTTQVAADALYALKLLADPDQTSDLWQDVTATGTVATADTVKSVWDVKVSGVVVAVQIDSTKQLFVGRIKINGAVVYNDPFKAAATGTLIEISPITLAIGTSNLDELVLQSSSSGGAAEVLGVPLTVTLYFESGRKARFDL